MKAYRSVLIAAVAAAVVSLISDPFIGRASQNNLYLPTIGIYSGLTAANTTNNALDSLLSCNSGNTAPTNQLGGAPKEGQCWLDTTSSTMKVLKRYTGAAWVVQAVFDVTNGIWVPPVGGGSGSVASASTTDLCASPQAFQTISGTTTINSFGSNCPVGTIKIVLFASSLTLTYASPILLPEQHSISTVTGDTAVAVYLGSGQWDVIIYTPVATPTKASPTISDFVLIQDSAASNTQKKSLLSAILALTGVNSINGNTGAFTTSHGIKTSTNDLQIDIGSIPNYLSGLTLSTAGASSTFSIAAGAATDSTNADFMKLASAMSKTTGSWAVGSTNGALDTGTIATSTWYHAFIIKRPDTGVVDACVSASITGCAAGVGNIPAAYTLSRRIGSMKINGSSQWTAFTQTGDTFIWAAMVNDVNNATTTGYTSYTLSVPPGVVVSALFRAGLQLGVSLPSVATIFTSLQENNQAPTPGLVADLSADATVAGQTSNATGSFERLTNTAAQIAARSNNTTGIFNILTYGWKDLRGKT